MRSNRKYDSELKREAVMLVVEQRLSVREAGSNLGITHDVLKGWVQKHNYSGDIHDTIIVLTRENNKLHYVPGILP